MKRILFIVIVILTLASAVPGMAADSRTPVWEVVELRDTPPGSESEQIEVSTRDHKIYITTPRTVEVSVYTILGQLITKKKISPGTVRLTIGTRGIYILKTETTTRRINL